MVGQLLQRLGSCLLPILPPRKRNLGPARILWNVLCNRLFVRLYGTARCKIAGFWGVRVNCALVSSDVRRTRGGVPSCNRSLQAQSHFRLVSTSAKPTMELVPGRMRGKRRLEGPRTRRALVPVDGMRPGWTAAAQPRRPGGRENLPRGHQSW